MIKKTVIAAVVFALSLPLLCFAQDTFSVLRNGNVVYSFSCPLSVSEATIPDPVPQPVPPTPPVQSGGLASNQWVDLTFAGGTTKVYQVFIPLETEMLNLQILGINSGPINVSSTDLTFSFSLPAGSLTPTYNSRPLPQPFTGNVLGADIGGSVKLYNQNYPVWQGYIYPAPYLPSGTYTLTIKANAQSSVRIGLFYR